MTSSHAPAIGDVVGSTFGGRYRAIRRIGRGGMASVYQATDLSLGRDVALKVFDPAHEALADERRWRSETALLARLNDPALVTLFDAGRDETTGREFLVMEYVDGPDLRVRLRERPLDAVEARGMLGDLTQALHAIHSGGIVHRDVKPANVLLAPTRHPGRPWTAKLADFGIARLIDDTRMTATGTAIGTPGYLSPEQVMGGPIGSATDVYALGLLVLEARTGAAPFPGPAAESAHARLVRDPVTPAWLGPEWCRLLAAMTDRDPARRPTALEVAMHAARLPDTDAARSDATAADAATSDATMAMALTRVMPGSAFPAPVPGTPPAPALSPTRVLPDTATTEAFDPPAPFLAPTRRETRTESRRTGTTPARPRRRVGTIFVAAVVVGLLASAAAVFVPRLAAPPAAPHLAPIPSVSGQLGVHLRELDRAVTR